MEAIDEIIDDIAADGYEFYRKLFKAIKEEDENFSTMTREDVSALAIKLTPIAMKRYYTLDYERFDI